MHGHILCVAGPLRYLLKADTVPSLQLSGLETHAERRRMTLVRIQCVVTVLPEQTVFRMERMATAIAVRGTQSAKTQQSMTLVPRTT